MFCTNCGKEIKEGNKFCTNCGYKVKQILQTDVEENDIKENYKVPLKEKIIIIIFLIIMLVVAIYLLIRQGVLKVGGFYL